MKKRTHFALFVLLAAVMASGCGTVCNLASDDPTKFGGVDHDPLFVRERKPELEARSAQGAVGKLLLVGLIYSTEFCLDLAGDTLTFPIAYLLTVADHPAESKSNQTTVQSHPDTAECSGAGALAHP
jgi:hypothetical protein